MKLHKYATILMMVLVVCFAFAVPVMAQQSKGGHDETTEDHTLTPPWAAVAVATPKTGPVVAGVHLLISEVGYRGLNSAACADSTEFLEIYNPTSSTIDLSKYYLSDVTAYSTLPVAGNIDIAATGSDFAMKFPNGATIAAGAYKIVAVDGGRFKRCAGIDADYMMWNAGGVTTAVPMVDVATNKPGTYPTYGSFTNTAEFVWLFFWDGISDLVCDVDLVCWGTGTAPNWPTLKTVALCQDGPDVGAVASCYNNDVGVGGIFKGFVVPASGSGTRQRITSEMDAVLLGGNGCIPGGPTPVSDSSWGHIKALYR
jgi:hypothetical protein